MVDMNFNKKSTIYKFFIKEIVIIAIIFISFTSLSYTIVEEGISSLTYKRSTDTEVSVVGDNRKLDKSFFDSLLAFYKDRAYGIIDIPSSNGSVLVYLSGEDSIDRSIASSKNHALVGSKFLSKNFKLNNTDYPTIKVDNKFFEKFIYEPDGSDIVIHLDPDNFYDFASYDDVNIYYYIEDLLDHTKFKDVDKDFESFKKIVDSSDIYFLSRRVSDKFMGPIEFILKFFLPIIIISTLIILIAMVFIFNGKIKEFFRRVSLNVINGENIEEFKSTFTSIFILINIISIGFNLIVLRIFYFDLDIGYFLLSLSIQILVSFIIVSYIRKKLSIENIDELIRG